jgi:hypothetical protein
MAAGLAIAASAAAFGRAAATPTLTGTVGPGFSINLKMNGTPIKTLHAGTYKLVIHDKASIHAFSLDGPHGYAKDFTTIPFVGTKTFSVKLRAGGYKFYCPAHEATMFGHFKVS